MSNTIQVKRGAKASLPILNAGEFGFSTDTHQIHIGDGAVNHEIAKVTLVDTISGTLQTDIDGKVSDIAYGTSWSGIIGIAPSKSAVYDEMETKVTSSPNLKIVQSGQTIQNVIDSITDAGVNNLYTVMVPPAHENENYTLKAYVTVFFLGQIFSVTDPASGLSCLSCSDWRGEFATDAIPLGVYSFLENTGSNAPGNGHGVAVLGWAQDNILGNHTLFGVEGRVDGHSGNNVAYTGVGALGFWQDPASDDSTVFSGTLCGIKSYRWVYDYDGSTPRNEGTTYGLFIDAPVGGAINHGIYVEPQTGSTGGVGIKLGGADIYTLWVGSGADNIDEANGIVWGESADTNLYRAGANLLKTDDDFECNTLKASVEVGEQDIKLDSLLSADGKYSGITCDGILGATLFFGDLVYLNTTDQRWELADADAEATAGNVQLALVTASGIDGDTRLLLLQGFIREDDWNFTSYGQALYVSTIAGDITDTVVSGSGDIVRVAGYASTFADQIYFNPSGTWIEIS